MEVADAYVFRFALFSRFIVFILQVLFNFIIPDHDAQVFVTPLSEHRTVFHKIASFLLDGFARWDAQYFLHISRHGYTYENTLAFFPLFPYVVRWTNFALTLAWRSISEYYCFLLIGVILNALFFSMAAVWLRKLTDVVFRSNELSFIVTLLFCINPASIFFTAFYSESLFCMLTFFGLYSLESESSKLAAFVLGLSAATRSNGVISFGFILHFIIRRFVKFAFYTKWSIRYFVYVFLSTLLKIVVAFFIFIIPFVSYQTYAFLLYCTGIGISSVPAEVIEYGILKNFKGPANNVKSIWCNWKIPLSYSYVQAQYWNVGFLNYYEVKQLPNFLLAMPIVMIVSGFSLKYFRSNWKFVLSMGLLPSRKCEDFVRNDHVVVYIVHGFFLAIFCTLFIHVQVTTRLIASSTPILYWIVGSLILPDMKHVKELCVSRSTKTGIIRDVLALCHLVMKSNKAGKFCCCYFASYFVIGTMLHVNHLPWT